MQKPDWFLLIEQWKERKMGSYGVSLPFLIGALGRKSKQSEIVRDDIHNLLLTMSESPVPGYLTRVTWCPTLYAPVFSVLRNDELKEILLKEFLCGSHDQVSLAIGRDIQSEYCLRCSECKECIEKLVEHALPYVKRGEFSCSWNSKGGEYQFGEFSDDEVLFIKNVIGA